MSRFRRWTGALAVTACALAMIAAAPASAQIKSLKTFKNEKEGFALKVPREWSAIPPQPEELDVLGKWAGDSMKRGGRYAQTLELQVLRFERKGGTTDSGKPVSAEEARERFEELQKLSRKERNARFRERMRPTSFKDWWERFVRTEGELGDPIETEIDKRPAKIYRVKDYSKWGNGTSAVIGVVQDDLVEWTLFYLLPRDEVFHPKRPKALTRVMSKALQSIKSLRLFEAEVQAVVDQGDMTPLEREIARVKAKLPEHWHVEPTKSGKYVVCHNIPQHKTSSIAFAKRIRHYLDHIRLQYEELFPPRRQITEVAVVRVCQDREEYHQYGGPGGSAGYFSPSAGELVIYDASKEGGKQDSYSTLFHEAFHQYIYHAVGELSPHRWFDEGYGDYFAGADPKKDFRIDLFRWRTGTVKTAVTEGKNVPLEKLIRFTRAQYYGERMSVCYAQGWALVYFLNNRAGKRNPRWAKILDTYFDVLVKTGDRDKAVDRAFEGVDMQKLEEAYVEFIKRNFK